MILLVITLCSSVLVHRFFGRTNRFHRQGRRVTSKTLARNRRQADTAYLLLVSCLLYFNSSTLKWRRYVPPKRRWNSTELYIVTTLKIVTDVITSNTICSKVLYSGSRDSAVDIATGYGLDGWGVGVKILVGSRIFSSPQSSDRLWDPPRLPSNR
jgi:hypothetical protein